MQRAFLAKGARRTLVSLWTVDDRASSPLLRQFYQQWLADGMSKSRALGRAQRLGSEDAGVRASAVLGAIRAGGAE